MARGRTQLHAADNTEHSNADDGEDYSQDIGDSNVPDQTGKKPKKTPEEKRADFMRLAESRVSRAIDALNGLSHLCNTSSYDWDDDMTDKIFVALEDKVATVHAAFIEAKAPKEGKKKAAKNLSFRL